MIQISVHSLFLESCSNRRSQSSQSCYLFNCNTSFTAFFTSSVHKLNPSYLATVNKHAKNSYRGEGQERDSDLDDISRKEKAVRIADEL